MADTSAQLPLSEFDIMLFTANLKAQLARKGGILKPRVSNASYKGLGAQVVKFVGPVYFTERTTAYVDTQITEVEHTQRWIHPNDYDVAMLVDVLDTRRILQDPTSAYVQRIVEAAGRKEDEVIMTAFFAPAATGKMNTSVTQFDARNTIPFNGQGDATVTGAQQGMSVAKLRKAAELLARNYVDRTTSRPMIATSWAQINNLLGEVAVASSDYNAVQPLVDGRIESFMGFDFVNIEDIIPTRTAQTSLVDGSTNANGLVRQCPVWVTDGMHFGSWQDVKVTVNLRPDKNNITQIHASMAMGATRLEEGKVLAIECAES